MLNITDDTVEYAILAPQDFTAGLAPLAEWHSRYGIRTKVYSMVETVGYPGSDTQEKIHMFLQDLNSTSPYLKYVLLVGDHDLIPSRYLHAGAHTWDLDYSYVSDHYYACLGSSWDTNHNGTYGEFGEEDWTPDVYVGRIPIDQASEVEGMVDKIINYRTYPPANDWIKRMLVWTTVMSPPNDGSPPEGSYDSYKDNAYKVHNYIDNRIPSGVDKEYLADYTELEGGNYTLAKDNFTRYNAVNQFNDGAALFTFAGQAYYDESMAPMDNALAHYSGDGKTNVWSISYNYDDCDDATNGERLPFAFIASCDTLNFSESDDTNLERLSTRSTGGVIGQIGNSGRSWRGEELYASKGNWWMIDKFWQLFFLYNGRAGEAFYKMKHVYARDILPPYMKPTPAPFAYGIKCNLYGYNFLGDPALDIWYSRPRNFKPISVTLWEGTNLLNMTVLDIYSDPVPDARLTVKIGDMYSTAISDENGNISLPYEASLGDDPVVSFHANGLIPMSVDASVSEEPADLTMVGDIEISEENPGIGTTVTLSVDIKNVGKQQAAAVKVGLYEGSFDEDNLIGELANVGSIAPGDVKEANIPWEAALSVKRIVAVVDPENDILESNEYNNRGTLDVDVVGADLFLEANTLTSSSGYNVSTVGSTTVSIFAHNIGELGADDITFAIYWDEIGPGYRVGKVFELPSMDPGAQTSINIDITPRSGYSRYVVAADPEGEIPEMNETNNYVTFYIFGNQPPVVDTEEWWNVELADEETVYFIDLEGHISDPDTSQDDLIIIMDPLNEEGVSALHKPLYDIEVNFEDDYEGTVKLTLKVSDKYSSSEATMNITRLAVNQPPVITIINDSTVIVDQKLMVQVEVEDEEPGEVVFSDDTVLFDIGAETGIISFTPTSAHVGTHLIRITATDSKGKSHTVPFNITVKPRYRPPALTGETDFTMELGKELTFTVEYKVDDTTKDSVTFSSSQPYVTVDGDGKVSVNPTKEMMRDAVRKEFTFTITIDDGRMDDSQTYTVSVIDKGGSGVEPNGEYGKNGKPLGGYLPVVIGIVVVLVLVVIAVILMVLRSRRKKMERTLMEAWGRKEEFPSRKREPRVGELPAYEGKEIGEKEEKIEEEEVEEKPREKGKSQRELYEELYGTSPKDEGESVAFEVDDDGYEDEYNDQEDEDPYAEDGYGDDDSEDAEDDDWQD